MVRKETYDTEEGYIVVEGENFSVTEKDDPPKRAENIELDGFDAYATIGRKVLIHNSVGETRAEKDIICIIKRDGRFLDEYVMNGVIPMGIQKQLTGLGFEISDKPLRSSRLAE
jgi:hypothetical protein